MSKFYEDFVTTFPDRLLYSQVNCHLRSDAIARASGFIIVFANSYLSLVFRSRSQSQNPLKCVKLSDVLLESTYLMYRLNLILVPPVHCCDVCCCLMSSEDYYRHPNFHCHYPSCLPSLWVGLVPLVSCFDVMWAFVCCDVV